MVKKPFDFVRNCLFRFGSFEHRHEVTVGTFLLLILLSAYYTPFPGHRPSVARASGISMNAYPLQTTGNLMQISFVPGVTSGIYSVTIGPDTISNVQSIYNNQPLYAASSLYVTVPYLPTGTYPLSIADSSGATSNTLSLQITAADPTLPVINHLSQYSANPGDYITVTGNNFSQNNNNLVLFYDDYANNVGRASSIPVNASSFSFYVPYSTSLKPGNSYFLQVFNLDAGKQSNWIANNIQLAISPYSFTTSISSVSPVSGPPGTKVTITGQGFGTTPSVYFGNFEADTAPYSPTVATFIVPAGTGGGTYKVRVDNTETSQTQSAYFLFTVKGSPDNTALPAISSINPTSASPGSSVTISGSNFDSQFNSVTLTGSSNTYTVDNVASSNNGTTILYTIPASVPAATYTLTVNNSNGDSNSASLTVGASGPAAPAISGFSPASAPVGTTIAINGNGFTASGNHLICTSGCLGAPVPLATLSSSDGKTLSYTIPSTPPGPYGLQVTNANGASNVQTFTVASACAGSGTDYAWSENIGWTSFNSQNNPGCGVAYSVNYNDANSLISGWAWSENIGWISFNTTTGCPDSGAGDASGTCQPAVDSTGAVTGWALACGSFDSQSDCTPGHAQSRGGGWDGWIHLNWTPQDGSGTSNRVKQNLNDCTWSGWAWGGTNVGWVHLNGSNYLAQPTKLGATCGSHMPTCALSATQSASDPSKWTLAWTTQNANSGTITNNVDANSISMSPISSGSTTVSPSQTTQYTGDVSTSGGPDGHCATTINPSGSSPVTVTLLGSYNNAQPSTQVNLPNGGGAVTFSWSTSANATGCDANIVGVKGTASIGTGGVTNSAGVTQTLTKSDNFTLTCHDNASHSGTSQPVQVTVSTQSSTSVNLSVTPLNVQYFAPGDPAAQGDISYDLNTSNVHQCGNIIGDDSANVFPWKSDGDNLARGTITNHNIDQSKTWTQIFSVDCQDSSGQLISGPASCNGHSACTQPVTVQGKGVTGGSCKINAGSFTANPAQVQKNDTSSLSWSWSNCGVCRITGTDGSDTGSLTLSSPSGNSSHQTNPLTQTTTFTLTCQDTNGNKDTAQTTVKVTSVHEF